MTSVPPDPMTGLQSLRERPYRTKRVTLLVLVRRWLPRMTRAIEIGLESLEAARADLRERGCGPLDRIQETLEGVATPAPDTPIAIYAHYTPSGRITAMVFRQLEAIAAAGFSIVFVTMSRRLDPESLGRLRQLATLVFRRRSFGRDFGAWADIWPDVRRRFAGASEILLMNDSMLGPVLPLEPLFARLRQREGVLGLTESVGGGVHLQSYFLLLRGQEAIAETDRFFSSLRLSSNKWAMVQHGEIGLSRHMLRAGIPVLAAFPYDHIETLALQDPLSRAALRASTPRLFPNYRASEEHELKPDDLYRARLALFSAPINPTHHFWLSLIRSASFPFIKTELVLKNPARLPDIIDLPRLLPPNSPTPYEEIEAHLAELSYLPPPV